MVSLRQIGAAVLLVMAAWVVSACAGTPVPPGGERPSTSEQQSGEGTPAPLSGEQAAAATVLTEALGGDARFGSVALDPHTGGLTLYWDGEPPADVLAAVRESHPDIGVVVRETDFPPGELQAAASALLASEHGVGAVEVRPDASGLVVYVHEDQVGDDLEQIAERLSAEHGVPVDVQGGAPVPAVG